MTREQHEWAAAHHGSAASKMASSRILGDMIADSMDVAYAVLFAVTAGHHGRAALRCEACRGTRVSSRGHPVDLHRAVH